MRCAWLVCLIAGCDFSATALPGPVDAGPGGQSDSGSQGGSDSGSGSGSGTNSECDVQGDSSLRLCLTFDHDPMVQDDSDHPHTILDDTGVTRTDHAGNPAALLSASSHVHLSEASDLDVNALTIDMWIAPAPSPLTQHNWLLDNNTQYFLTYEMTGQVRCGIGGSKTVTSNTVIAPATWHHVACTYDGAHELHVYVDGDRSGCVNYSSAIPTGGTDGIAIGANYGAGNNYTENYVGGIDAVHVYARAMSDSQVCSAAGQHNCQAVSCNQGGPE